MTRKKKNKPREVVRDFEYDHPNSELEAVVSEKTTVNTPVVHDPDPIVPTKAELWGHLNCKVSSEVKSELRQLFKSNNYHIQEYTKGNVSGEVYMDTDATKFIFVLENDGKIYYGRQDFTDEPTEIIIPDIVYDFYINNKPLEECL